jgi:predicted nucleic acid-binding Zn ribbon protein
MAKSPDSHAAGQELGLNREAVGEETSGSVTAKVVGRPSLTGPSQVSPGIKARVPETLKLALDQEAKRQGRTPSVLIREALEDYLYGK